MGPRAYYKIASHRSPPATQKGATAPGLCNERRGFAAPARYPTGGLVGGNAPLPSVDQLLVLDAVGLLGGGAQAALPVGFVVLVVALEPDRLAVAFEGQDVGGDAVQEPA